MSDVPKAIGSLAKKPSDVTRQGTQKLKFVPTLPARRKKEDATLSGQSTSTNPVTEVDSGKDDGQGRGRGRGMTRKPVEMAASGPFAMGPALAGHSTRRPVLRSNLAAPTPNPATTLVNSRSHPFPLKQEETMIKGQKAERDNDDDVYSDPDEGVKIIDMQRVRNLDWMAPETLRMNQKQSNAVEKTTEEIDAANVLNGNEDEQEIDVISDFSEQDHNLEQTLGDEKIFLFKFPSPFPVFLSASEFVTDPGPDTQKKVTFLTPAMIHEENTASISATITPNERDIGLLTSNKLDGSIGRLEIHRSGAIKIRLANDLLFNVNSATQSSFQQQVVYMDRKQRRLAVLGEVHKNFIASPDIAALLNAIEDNK
ncbi:hypothetical protein AMATHDRAFT_68867 [Amanita thiersii Skay4041]|uniref:DNA-directed RNA polymerase III subunit RPC4 n=1 Tax=Amanita thiersii Skay4041 TaxID=703135 RepID=A0A2A9N9X4_9AGAR|nr:hypothetical protein AMATHDRAFT_68867 [Amanita thiersii Skay4041]